MGLQASLRKTRAQKALARATAVNAPGMLAQRCPPHALLCFSALWQVSTWITFLSLPKHRRSSQRNVPATQLQSKDCNTGRRNTGMGHAKMPCGLQALGEQNKPPRRHPPKQTSSLELQQGHCTKERSPTGPKLGSGSSTADQRDALQGPACAAPLSQLCHTFHCREINSEAEQDQATPSESSRPAGLGHAGTPGTPGPALHCTGPSHTTPRGGAPPTTPDTRPASSRPFGLTSEASAAADRWEIKGI